MSTETIDEPTHTERERPHVPYLFVVLEGHDVRSRGARYELSNIDEVDIGRGDVRSASKNEGKLELRFVSPAMSSAHARIVRSGTRFVVEDMGSRNGTLLDGAAVRAETLEEGAILEAGRVFITMRSGPSVSPSDVTLAELLTEPFGLRTIIPELAERREALRHIAKSQVPVLVLGDTGTGKELLAQAVHAASGRAGRFVPVNCGALPATLVEGLLFGHTRGAFSGALKDEVGFVRAADGGTLFLDEIGDLPLASQAALLRVLQEHEVTPVGSTRAVNVDLRVVAATHRSLEQAVAQGTFRADLLARLRGFVYEAPSLESRREDLGVFVGDLLEEMAAKRPNLALSQAVARSLVRYSWPANMRELAQCLATSVALAKGDSIEQAHLPAAIVAATREARPSSAPTTHGSADESSEELSEDDKALRTALVSALEANGGNVAAVSRVMGKAPFQIHRWSRRFGLDLKTYRG